MTLDDLKTGMMVMLENGQFFIVMRDFIEDHNDIFAGLSNDVNIPNIYIHLSNYNNDMTSKTASWLDIMRVYQTYEGQIDIMSKLLWERKKYKEVTIKEIEEKFGCKVKIVGNEEQHNDGWIPCSERLPENEDDVLCWYEYRIMQGDHEGEMNRECGIGYYNKSFKRWCGEIYYKQDYKVIAWRPLPEPYKEDEEE